MAADATLVGASFKEAGANVKRFDPIVKSQAELVSGFMDPITTALDAKDLEVKQQNKEFDELKDAQIAKFTDTADAINVKLSTWESGGKEAGMHEQIYNNTYDHLDELKQEHEKYNTVGDDDTPDNKKKRIEILGKLEQVKNSTVQLRSDILAIGKLAGSKDGGSQMSKSGMTTSEIAMTNEIFNMDGDYSNVKQRWDKKTNDMFFDVRIPDDVFNKLPLEEQKLGQTRTWSASDIKKNFFAIPKEMEGNLVKQSGDYEKDAKKAKWDDEFDVQMSRDETAEILGSDKKAASHIFQNRQHGQPKTGYDVPGGGSGKWEAGSWANALEAHTDLNGEAYKLDPAAHSEIVADLIKSGGLQMSDVDGADGSTTDNKISAKELEAVMGTENRDKIIDVLVNHKNPLYDHELSVEEFSNWKAKQNKTKFNKNKPKKPSSGGTLTEEVSAVDNWFKDLGQGGNFGTTPYKGKDGVYYNDTTIRDIYNDMTNKGELMFEKNLYTFDDGVWTGLNLDKNSEDYNTTREIGNQETFARNILNQRNDVWTKAEVKANIEEVDSKTGELKTQAPANLDLNKSVWSKLISTGNDDDIADNLNELFKLKKRRTDGKNPWMFMPYNTVTPGGNRSKLNQIPLSEAGTGLRYADDTSTDDLMLYNAETGDVMMDGSKRRSFTTGDAVKSFDDNIGENKNTKEIIDLLTELGVYSEESSDKGFGSKYPVTPKKEE